MLAFIAYFRIFFICVFAHISIIDGNITAGHNRMVLAASLPAIPDIDFTFPFKLKSDSSKVSMKNVVNGLVDDYRKEVKPLLQEVLDLVRGGFKYFLRLPKALKACVYINCGVYVLWKLASTLGIKMRSHWIRNQENLRAGRWWTLLAPTFSHESFSHLLANMAVLLRFGPAVVGDLGEEGFIDFVLISGLFSSAASMISRQFAGSLLPSNRREAIRSKGSLGFSGVNCAIIALYAGARPQNSIAVIQGTQPVPVDIAVRRMLLLEMIGLLASVTIFDARIDYGAHVGGYLTGIVYQEYLDSKKKPMVALPWNQGLSSKKSYADDWLSNLEKFANNKIIDPIINSLRKFKDSF